MNINTTIILEELTRNKHNHDGNKNIYYVYALYKNDEVVYIGQTKRLHSRIDSHTNTKDFDQYSYMQCENLEDSLEKETAMIIKLQPKYNIRIGDNYISVASFTNKVNAFSGSNIDDFLSVEKVERMLMLSGVNLVQFKGEAFFNKKYAKEGYINFNKFILGGGIHEK